MAEKDYYSILGIPKTATPDEIKAAYRRNAKKFHPDVFATASDKEKTEAEAKFKDCQHAYDVLSDPQKKSAYDQYGSEEPRMGGFNGGNPFGGQGGDFNDMFSSIFDAFTGGGKRSSRQPEQRVGDDIEITLVLSFKEACFGVEKEITYQRIEKCESCNGTGAKNGTSLKTCPKCNGQGRILVKQSTVFGVMQSERACDSCNGRGKIVTENCQSCGGKGLMRRSHTLKVKIPAGVDNGQVLTMRQEGSAAMGSSINGNLIIVFKVKPHNLFKRNGNDLAFDLPITFMQAVLGDKMDVPTLTSPITLDIPEGSQDGTIIRVRNKGIKSLRNDSSGDLYIKLVIDIPKNLTLKQKKDLDAIKSSLLGAKYEKIESYNRSLREL